MMGRETPLISAVPFAVEAGSSTTPVPVLEIGGTHVTAALVEPGPWQIVPGSEFRGSIRAHGTADEILQDIAATALNLPVTAGSVWSIAIPGPFDYARGIGQFEHVGKFDSLKGVDVRSRIARFVGTSPTNLHFINDADAYGVGEYASGAGKGFPRLVCITLGTGVGSAFLVDGEPLNEGPSVPPEGSAHLLNFNGRPLEDTVSRRAIRASYAEAAGLNTQMPDVHEIAELARGGNGPAERVLRETFMSLGAAIAGTLKAFNADALVIGGSMARSWDLIAPAIRAGLLLGKPQLHGLPLLAAERVEHSPIIGAAFWAARHSGT